MRTRSQWVSTIQDQCGPFHRWPSDIKSILLTGTPFSPHVKNTGRFSVTVFFLTQGMNPVLIREFWAENYPHFDRSAWAQIEWILRKYPTSNWTQMNVAHQWYM